MDFVQLTVCWNALEAKLLKGKLASAGIPCVLQGDTVSTVGVGFGGANSAFQIPVLVRTEDLASARNVINC
ncbi:MAG: DUF2007 domain-containing protein [Bacteroidales bacterium]|jgi:hypothetical protein|nr:DUF2007 domain-containing protein [Bacteroidales bacterium]MCR5361183.1 DUF2007 domain-containing protein [Bacteroidales bacterium]